MTRLLAATLLTLFIVNAAGAEGYDAEVQFLLGYVEQSGCTFVRNGSEHDAAGAADHLRLKYNRGGKYVNSAEQFIDRLATESSWTGKKYTVTCNGVTQPSGEWLHQALQAHRENY